MIVVDTLDELRAADEDQPRLLRRPAPQPWLLHLPGKRPLFVPRGYEGVPDEG